MQKVALKLKENSYDIVVGKNILPKIGAYLRSLKIGEDAIIITNPIVRKLHGKAVEASLKKSGFSVKVLEVPDGEKSKSVKCAFGLIEKIALYDCFKQPFIVALGGGVIGDLAGYVAVAYKRGIPYVQVPTTFLAQVDSSIGGKVAIDLPIGKNLVGAFYQPKVVWTDVSTLLTLDKRQVLNGFAEAVKYGIIKDKALFDYILKNKQKLIDLNENVLSKVVLECSRIKAEVVSSDERETKGIRAILNFGHTVGHAVEAAGKYNCYHHGEAVSLGMRAAIEISYKVGLLSQKDAGAVDNVLDEIGFPKVIKKCRLSDIMRIMKHDKKFISGKNRFVLMQRVGKVKVVEGIAIDVIYAAVKKLMSTKK